MLHRNIMPVCMRRALHQEETAENDLSYVEVYVFRFDSQHLCMNRLLLLYCGMKFLHLLQTN